MALLSARLQALASTAACAVSLAMDYELDTSVLASRNLSRSEWGTALDGYASPLVVALPSGGDTAYAASGDDDELHLLTVVVVPTGATAITLACEACASGVESGDVRAVILSRDGVTTLASQTGSLTDEWVSVSVTAEVEAGDRVLVGFLLAGGEQTTGIREVSVTSNSDDAFWGGTFYRYAVNRMGHSRSGNRTTIVTPTAWIPDCSALAVIRGRTLAEKAVIEYVSTLQTVPGNSGWCDMSWQIDDDRDTAVSFDPGSIADGDLAHYEQAFASGLKSMQFATAAQNSQLGDDEGVFIRALYTDRPWVDDASDPKVVVYGDSISNGMSCSIPCLDGWVAILRRGLGGSVALDGTAFRALWDDAYAASSAEMAVRIADLAARLVGYGAHHYVLAIGRNDYGRWSLWSAGSFCEALGQLADAIKDQDPGAKVYLVEILFGLSAYEVANAYRQTPDQYRAVQWQVAQSRPWCTFIDTTGWLDSSDMADGVHPNIGGHSEVGARMLNVMEPAVEELQTNDPPEQKEHAYEIGHSAPARIAWLESWTGSAPAVKRRTVER